MRPISEGRLSKEKFALGKEEVSELLRFFSAAGNSVSFYLGWPEVHNNAHRAEAIVAKDLVQSVSHSASGDLPAGVATDLQKISQKMETVRSNSSKLQVVFACSGAGLWREFELPCSVSRDIIELGQYLRLIPLISALQSTKPYGVVLVETGRARVFGVSGTDIEEVTDAIESADLRMDADDSRVGWSSHVDRDQRSHERAYFKQVAEQIREFSETAQLNTLIVGCREEVWADLRPQLERYAELRIGGFHLPSFSMSKAEVVKFATPVFESLEKAKIEDTLRRANENPTASAVGMGDVLAFLGKGNVRQVVLGSVPREVVSECRTCGYVSANRDTTCQVCRGTFMGYLPIDEALIRRAIFSDAEVLIAEAAGVRFNNVAALTRY